jgi:hypothetical protein
MSYDTAGVVIAHNLFPSVAIAVGIVVNPPPFADLIGRTVICAILIGIVFPCTPRRAAVAVIPVAVVAFLAKLPLDDAVTAISLITFVIAGTAV